MSTATALVATWLAATGPGQWDGQWPVAPQDQPCRQIDNCAPVEQVKPLPTIVGPNSIMPPPEYDYPFKGKLYISAENDFAQMIVGCQWSLPYRDIHGCSRPPGFYTPGIGRMKPDECMILLAKRELIKGVHDYDMVIRHEQSHCNGWRH
jgi:hypothetical protein